MNRVKIGEIAPLNGGEVRGMELSGEYLKMSGLVVTSVHPQSIAVSHNRIEFKYSVGGKQVVRCFAVERDGGGRITAFTSPDSVRTEVQRNG